MNKMTREEYKKWVSRRYCNFVNNDRYIEVYSSKKENLVVVLDRHTGKTEKYKFDNPEKDFDKIEGIAVAYTKLLGAEVPEIVDSRVNIGEYYRSISVRPTSCSIYCYTEEGTPFDTECYKNNNYFKTVARATEVLDKIVFLLKLEKMHDAYCPEYKPDWKNLNELKYTIYFDNISYKFKVYQLYSSNYGMTYFPTLEIAEKVCGILNEGQNDNE